MDPLTHTLVGAALSRTRLARGTRLGTPALVLGANLPDIDALTLLAGGDTAFAFRRGLTHGPLGVLLLPCVLTGVMLALDRRKRRRDASLAPANPGRLLGLAALGCLTHPLLDWLNTYGVRLLLPFDERWFYGDAVFIIDPWLWLVLGSAVFLSGRGRIRGWVVLAVLTSSLVLIAGERVPAAARLLWATGLGVLAAVAPRVRGRSPASRVATAGLVVAGVYIGVMLAASALAARAARTELVRRGIGDIERLMVGPIPANPSRWDVVAATATGYQTGTWRWIPRPRLDLGRRIERPGRSPAVDAALAAPQVRGAVRWMRFPFVEVDETAEGFTVHVMDARYVRVRTGGFGSATVRLDRQLRPLEGRSGR